MMEEYYILIEDRKNILNKFCSYAVMLQNLNHMIFFFYSFPNDVVGVTSLNILEGKVTRYQINLTDHAFWLGARCIDKCIEFRDYGANVSAKYRGISKNIIAKLPFYPIVNKDISFQGFPFQIVKGQKVVFSGGALYKTFGGQNKYYDIIDNILKNINK